MKKIIALSLALLLALAIFTGCSGKSSAKTGLAVVTSLASSKSAETEKDGQAQIDSTIVAVIVDAGGKILDCYIDAAQTKIAISNTGEIKTELDKVFKTKNELGSEYDMKKSSSIGKEWNEQAQAFADYVVGKTISQVKAIAVDDAGKATGSDLKSSVTISITGLVNAVEQAVNNAKELGAGKGDTISVGTVTSIGNSKNATEGGAGVAQAYSTYAAVTKNADGKVTSCVIDASQGIVEFDATGKITTDLTKNVNSKNVIGDAYGMKSKSGIGKEWYEQAAAFASYVKGKTASEVKAVAVDEEGKATGSDLKSSVTIGIGDFIAAIEKALK